MKRPSGADPRRPVVKPSNGLPARWEPFLESLRGFGLLNSQMNEHRLYLPVELRRRLGRLLDLPWVISYWCEGCLRAVPQHLWRDYLQRVGEQLNETRLLGWLEEAIVQPAACITLEQGGRWNLPPALTALSRIGGGALCLLCPSDGGLEIWEANAKQHRLRTITEELRQRQSLGLPVRPGPSALPPSPGATSPVTGAPETSSGPPANGRSVSGAPVLPARSDSKRPSEFQA